tara:strand:+ start:1030 stop:1416 length:387 start_codon:yes stop_codon:yes gene_type:complete
MVFTLEIISSEDELSSQEKAKLRNKIFVAGIDINHCYRPGIQYSDGDYTENQTNELVAEEIGCFMYSIENYFQNGYAKLSKPTKQKRVDLIHKEFNKLLQNPDLSRSQKRALYSKYQMKIQDLANLDN